MEKKISKTKKNEKTTSYGNPYGVRAQKHTKKTIADKKQKKNIIWCKTYSERPLKRRQKLLHEDEKMQTLIEKRRDELKKMWQEELQESIINKKAIKY